MTDLVAQLVGALEETLLFCETFSNRWDGQTGAHPFGMVERARSALSAAKDGGWLPIETAPKDGRHILISDGERVSVGGWLTDIDHGAEWEGQIGMAGWWAVDLGSNSDKPTHWQPLPNPPKEQA